MSQKHFILSIMISMLIFEACTAKSISNTSVPMDQSEQINDEVLCKLEVSETITEDSLVLNLKLPHAEHLRSLIPALANEGDHPMLRLTVSFETKPTAGYEVYINNHLYGGKSPKNEKPQGFMTFYEASPKIAEDDERASQTFRFLLRDFVDFDAYDGNLTIKIKRFAGGFEGLQLEEVALVRKR